MVSFRAFPALTALRTVLFFIAFFFVTLPFLPFYPLAYAKSLFGVGILKAHIRLQLLLLRLICGLGYSMKGLENRPDGPVLYAARHESMWETVYFHTLLDNPAMLAKKELFDLPFFGRLLKKNRHIVTDRTGSADALIDTLRAARSIVKSGRSVLIFPSGTRLDPASAELKKGVVVLYKALKRPVVPVVLDSGRVFPKGSWLIRPGCVHVRVLPVIPFGLTDVEFGTRLSAALATDP